MKIHSGESLVDFSLRGKPSSSLNTRIVPDSLSLRASSSPFCQRFSSERARLGVCIFSKESPLMAEISSSLGFLSELLKLRPVDAIL
ncbi:hypothetical protein D3C77_552640 [compost metagenome]